MIMKRFIDKLEEKWGKLYIVDHYLENGKMSFISKKARLNVLFRPENLEDIKHVIKCELDAEVLPELLKFYESYNGCRLFFGSLNIYGMQVHPSDIFEPYDIILENKRHLSELQKNKQEQCRYVFFGSIGGEYLIGYDKQECSKIYCVKSGESQILKEYENLEVFFERYFRELFQEYDIDGRKKHPNKKYKGIPVLENVSHTLI